MCHVTVALQGPTRTHVCHVTVALHGPTRTHLCHVTVAIHRGRDLERHQSRPRLVHAVPRYFYQVKVCILYQNEGIDEYQ